MARRTTTDIAQLNDPTPRARILSNGRYHVVLSGAGTGYSALGDTLLTAWEGDRVEDADGLFVFLRDLDSGATWSVGAQPAGLADAGQYAAPAAEGTVRIERRQHAVAATLTTCVWPDLDAELRRLTLRNASARERRIEITVYAPLVLNQAGAHAAHPAFSKLFVETEHLADRRALLARRRPRAAGEHPPLMALLWPDGGAYSVETDRARFLGRNRPAARATAFAAPTLSGTVGSVLDPAFAIRETIVLPAKGSAQRDLVLAGAAQPDALLALLDACAPQPRRDGAAAAAATAARDRAAALGLDAAAAIALQELAAALLYQHPALRAPDAVRQRANGALSQIWALALGGRPLAGAEGAAVTDTLDATLRAHAYWRALGLGIDLLLVATDAADALRLEAAAQKAPGVIVRARDAVAAGDLDVALAWASMTTDAWPNLTWGATPPSLPDAAQAPSQTAPAHGPPRPPLLFDNGVGGFTADGDEYVITVGPGSSDRPPLAWINVVANEHTGFLASESGAGYTWSRNSREHRLSAWGNDPISDPHSEALYLRDDDAPHELWSPQPGPIPAAGATYEVRHGFGYTRWQHNSHGFDQEVVQFVPRNDPVKLTRLRITNTSGRARRITAAAYARLVLGVTPQDSARLALTERDADTGALIARNRLADEFGDGEAFAAVHAPAGATISGTTDRAAFLGRNGSPATPQGLRTAALDGTVGSGLDPCFALQASVPVAPGATIEWVFCLGEAVGRETVREIVRRYAAGATVDEALQAVRTFWRDLVGAVHVRTPVPAIDVMVNGWLLYQVLSCRIWGRTALYQSGGAFGFRDQLQDAAALIMPRPEVTRAQIVLHAAHQFVEGDVQHWWHPPVARGIRTRFSDDLLWLPFIAAAYISATGDHSILGETVGYVKGRLLGPGEDEAYFQPAIATERTDIYEHCCRAIDRSLAVGTHGLPLMGTGDWNDGMNRVGREGRGESVWVGFFLHDVLGTFAPYCAQRGDHTRAEQYATHREALGAALEEGGWDGEWYRRAYYDDGTPLGSAGGDECRIDAIAQAWAVISGAAPRPRAEQAMAALESHLVEEGAGLIRLLAPPFDRGAHDPGYIKGYVPGIRENGGQYTHGAMWAVQAFAMLGRRDRAAALLEMLSPATHGGTAERLAIYQVEPYVIVADIYGVAPHLGRGGWTWYTGSAGWMYRIAVERLLGVRTEAGDTLVVDPRIPDAWPGFRVALRLNDGASRYAIEVENPTGHAAAVTAIDLDGVPGRVDGGIGRIALLRDGVDHAVRVRLG